MHSLVSRPLSPRKLGFTGVQRLSLAIIEHVQRKAWGRGYVLHTLELASENSQSYDNADGWVRQTYKSCTCMYDATYKLSQAFWWEGIVLTPVTLDLWTISAHVMVVNSYYSHHTDLFLSFTPSLTVKCIHCVHPESECGWLSVSPSFHWIILHVTFDLPPETGNKARGLCRWSWSMVQRTLRAHLHTQSDENKQLKYLGHIQCHSVRHAVYHRVR